MKISVASDHAGFEQKQHVVEYLKTQGYDVLDEGPDNDTRVDYPDYAALVARDVANKKADYGVLLCGTGLGMAISANKISGVRAINVTTPDFAALGREHNDANIIALSARFVDEATNEHILDTFLSTDFGGGRHADRVKKITNLEELN